ncbi:MAG: hypothetical protein HY658_07135 [Actinobacteria bacterium]|nr:hypothetical protein [Actinomycetota bacterium]
MGRTHHPGSKNGLPGRPGWAAGWQGLPSWGRISFLGLGAAALLAVALGIYIPRQVERHMLRAQTDSNRQVLEALLETRTLPLDDMGSGMGDLDRFVASAILRGDFVRVKLWSPEGRILYSDDRRLVGRTFALSAEVIGALNGEPQSELSDLSDPENSLERTLAHRLLEFYFPVHQGGRVVAVWEVYQSLDRFEDNLSRVRLAVWTSVGSGLGVLLVFLVSSFGSLLSVVQQRRREAEARSRDLSALLEVSRSVGSTLDPAGLSGAAVRTIQEEGRFQAVGLVRPPVDGSPASVMAVSAEEGCPAGCVRAAAEGRASERGGCSSLVIGLGGDREEALSLVACRAGDATFTEEDRALLETAGEHIRMALENADLYGSLRTAQREQRELTRRLVTAHEDEANRVVGEIHDGLGQDLHRVLFGLRGCRGGSPEETADELDRLESIVAGSVGRLRRLLQELRPTTLEDVGLGAALRGLADRLERRDRLRVEMRGDDRIPADLPLAVRVAAFRIAQEALRNVLKHSDSRRATVDVGAEDGVLEVRVSDEGRGLPSTPGDGLGMWLMRERAEAVGGTLSVESGPEGTVVSAVIPLGGHR